MPKLEIYDRSLGYSYALGIYPATLCLTHAPARCRRLLIHSAAGDSQGVGHLIALAQAGGVRVEQADRLLEKLSKKANCFAAAVFDKVQGELSGGNHVVLYRPSDSGNLGTMLRTCLGLGFVNIGIIRPAVDVFDPRVVRASMGAQFSLNVAEFEDFEGYRQAFPQHALYPFMLDGAVMLEEAVAGVQPPYALVFGNEAAGLPPAFGAVGQAVRIPHGMGIDSLNLAVAVGIGAYAFARGPERREEPWTSNN